MRIPNLLIAVSFLALLACTSAAAADDEPYLDVYVVPHTHDDVGWVETPGGYYTTAVHDIISTAVEALSKDASRRFIYVEQYFFHRWWTDVRTTDTMRNNLRTLVKNKQWEFIIGGWVMHDEATTTYSANIDQMTEGHQFLLSTFNVTPIVGWQIDPFGASSVVAEHNKLAGFKYHVIDRINWRLKDQLEKDLSMEFIWQPSKSLGKNNQILTHILDANYCDPMLSGFNFEGDTWSNPPVTDSNIEQRAQDWATQIRKRQSLYKTNVLLIPWGCDFRFVDAHVQFDNMDKILKYMQQNKSKFNMNVRYTLLSDFFNALAATNAQFPTYTGDFFAYDDNDESWWTGYYTSRTALKGLVREGEALLRATDSLMVASNAAAPLTVKDYLTMDILRRAMAAVQHHDGVSGTEKQFVADNYAKHIIEGEDSSRPLQYRALQNLVLKPGSSAAVPVFTNNSKVLFDLDKQLEGVIVVYNSLGWTHTDWIAVPSNHTNYMMIDSFGLTVPSQTNVSPLAGPNDPPFVIWFRATVPPLGFTTYYMHSRCFNGFACKASKPHMGETLPVRNAFGSTDIMLENDYLRVNISATTNRISNIQNKKSGVVANVNQDVFAYDSFPGPGQASGAYIFRPTGPANPILPSNTNPKMTVTRGFLVQEVVQQFTPWATQIIRLFDKQNFVEVETQLGPIPGNKEVISRFTTSLQTKNQITTDDNGWQYQLRTYDSSPQLAIPANFYPTIYSSFISDANGGAQLSLISDRSRGASSQFNGEIEVMLHRRLLQDDSRGVDEALDDTDVVHPTLRVVFDSAANSDQARHQLAYELNFPPTVFYSTIGNHMDWINNYVTDYSAMADLPPAIHLISLKYVGSGTNAVIVRLGHLYDVGESLGVPVQVDLAKTFTGIPFKTIKPVTLTANQMVVDSGLSGTVVKIYPKEIKTYLLGL